MDELTIWLESLLPGAVDVYDDCFLPSDYDQILNNKNIDYKNIFTEKNDIDLINNSLETNKKKNNSLSGMSEFYKKEIIKKYVQNYDQINVLIYPGIIRSHTNYLFKKMMLVIKQQNITLKIPNIAHTNSKNITYDSVEILTCDDKMKFYNFCLENSFKNNRCMLSFESKKIMQPTKEMFGKIEYNETIKNEKKNILLENIKKGNIPYNNLNIAIVNELIDNLNDQLEKIIELINTIWNEVFYQYQNEKLILEKLANNLESRVKINKFFFDLNSIKKINVTIKKLNVTKTKLELEELKNKFNVTHEQNKNINKINTQLLVGNL